MVKMMNASSDDEDNNDQDSPKTPYDGESMNAYYNNNEVSPNPLTNNEIINDNYDEVTLYTPTNDGNNKTIDNEE